MGGAKQKSKFRKALSKVVHFSSWKLALIFILLCFLSATLLRFDHIKMVDLRNAVLQADESEDDAAIAESLNSLKNFTQKHIVFNLHDDNGRQTIIFGTGPFYLEHQYMRKAKEELARAQAEADKMVSNPNGNIYRKAADVCDALGIKYGWRYPDQRYIDCWMSELDKYPTTDNLTVQGAKIPSTELYRYDFASPIWYPCLSGIVILLTVLAFVALAIRFLIWLFLRLAIFVLDRSTKRH